MTRAERRSRPVGVVEYPWRWNSYDITHVLRNSIWCDFKMEARGQVAAWVEFERRRRRCIFDLAIFDKDRKCVAIIEVKRGRNAKTDTRQLNRYRAFGLPVLLCRSQSEIEKTMSSLKTILMPNGGIPSGE